MRFVTLRREEEAQVHVVVQQNYVVSLGSLDARIKGDLLRLISLRPSRVELDSLLALARSRRDLWEPLDATRYAPPYLRPRKILGIGLNYRQHAEDRSEQVLEEPASFIKGDHTIGGFGASVRIPRESDAVTGEAELGMIIGREMRNVPTDRVFDYVFGVTPVLDFTAEDILLRNARYLTRAKNFPDFFLFGPEVVTLDEFLAERDLSDAEVATLVAREGARESRIRVDRVKSMIHSPESLLSSHSYLMPWFPGDILSTGTPGAIHVTPGESVRARVSGLAELVAQVEGRG